MTIESRFRDILWAIRLHDKRHPWVTAFAKLLREGTRG